MADAVTSQTLVDTDKRAVIKLTNLSDGSGESSVKKVDVSALNSHSDGTACSRVTIDQIWYDVGGMRVDLEWAATTNVKALMLGGSAAAGNDHGHMDFSSIGGIKNTEATGVTGDVKLTLPAVSNGDTASVHCEWIKVYA